MAPTGNDGELQFDRAEFGGANSGQTCSNCRQPVTKEYHQLGGRIFCGNCRVQLEQSIGELHNRGSLGRGLLFGFAAALAGALLFWVVLTVTGYQFGLLAVVVGWAVGKAVRIGSRSLGGWKYQAIAMVLTYLSIVSTYTPEIHRALQKGVERRENAEKDAQSASQAAPRASRVVHIGASYYLLLLGIALVYPWLGGFSNILGLVIIGIGLWEAWKFNRRVEVKFTGPFSVAGTAPVSPA